MVTEVLTRHKFYNCDSLARANYNVSEQIKNVRLTPTYILSYEQTLKGETLQGCVCVCRVCICICVCARILAYVRFQEQFIEPLKRKQNRLW